MNLKTSTKIPVMFILPTLGTGGSEKVVLDLCNHLIPYFFPVAVSFRGGALLNKMKKADITTHVLNRSDGIDLSLVIKLIRLIKKYHIKVVNSHHFVSLFYGFWATSYTHVPMLHTEHSRWELETLPYFWNLWFKFFCRRLKMINTVSNESYAYLSNTYNIREDRLFLTLNGIDIGLFEAASKKHLPRNSLGLNSDDIVIGIVGNLREEKRQELLIKALALLKEKRKRFLGLIIGDGPCRSKLEALVSHLKLEQHVIFLGTRNDVPYLYGLFDIYCLTSRYEGLPLTLLEAMAAGVPTIGTDVLGIREVIQNEENGLLVNGNDPQELADAIVHLSQDSQLRIRLTAAAKRVICDEYSLASFVHNYEQLFRKAVGHN